MKQKTQLRKRFESLIWRAWMMSFAVLLAYVAENIGEIIVNKNIIIGVGLIFGEISKLIHNELNRKGRV